MRLDRFDLNLLVVLDVLLEERSVTRASKRLHIGQSATSSALGRLREYFNDELLVPFGRRLELTPLAQSLAEPVRDALLRTRAAIALQPNFNPASVSRNFTVCASDYVVEVVLAQAIRDLAVNAPGFRIDLIRSARISPDLFEQGGIDLLIMPAPYTSGVKHPQQLLFSDDHVCMVCANHPLVKSELSIEQYLNLGHVSVRIDQTESAFEEWLTAHYGTRSRIECTVDNFSVLPLVIIGTQRIATLHRRLAEQMALRFPVAVLEAPFQMRPVVEMMVWPRYTDDDPSHRWLRSAIVRATTLDAQIYDRMRQVADKLKRVSAPRRPRKSN